MSIGLENIVQHYYKLFTDAYIHAFTFVIMFDILTGLIKAWWTKTINSSVGTKGLIKHTLILLLGITVYPYLKFINFNGVAYIIIGYFIVTYCISILENLDAIGISFPKGIKKRLEKIQKELDDKEV